MPFDKHVKVRQEKFGAVVFDTMEEKVYVSNESGADIIALLQEGKDAARIAEQLAQQYDRDQTTIEQEINEYILTLKEKKIIE